MKNPIIQILTVLSTLALGWVGCDNNPLQPGDRVFDFSFETGTEGWTGGFSDYPVGEDAKFELSFGHSALPESLDVAGKALRISGKNHSDDLFMFIKKRISGLEPNGSYSLAFTLKLASDAPDNAFGVGGAPAITLKTGATNIEPAGVEQDGYYKMNIDKGNQLQDGNDMMTIGDTGNGTEAFKYVLIERTNNERLFEINADQNGEVWVIIGTDSGFEGTTTLFYDSVHLLFRQR